ncbi:hypothetical protein [Burkholderia thailandensis]|uniref:hypothetical protein n=1 Tax=Burkholderia thailandensis TaxID=57975 RepID=UPI0005B74ECD|nr:hypothetical protein [Burkholderia thailandensis]AVR10267.1 hypothetical protein A8H31_23615 [Burkholderia thailandensis]KIS55685.1 hypothetical protein BTP_2356 [Burkholderia thailandensis Phuket 4W-1]
MTTDKSRADAPTDEQIASAWFATSDARNLRPHERAVEVVRKFLAASPVEKPAPSLIDEDAEVPPIMYNGDTKRDPALRELLARQATRHVLTNSRGDSKQPAAAPIDIGVDYLEKLRALMVRLGLATNESLEGFGAALEDNLYRTIRAVEALVDATVTPAPSPADERAAFEAFARGIRMDVSVSLEGHYTDAATAYAWAAWRTRAASANETGAEEADETLIERLKLLLSGDAAFCRTTVARAAIEQAIAVLSRSPAMAAEAVAIPAGYALVPIEPTEEMIAVGVGKGDADFYGDALVKAEVRSDYQAMIAAAPPLVRYQILTEEGGLLDVPQAYYERFKSDATLTRVVNLMQPTAAHDESSIEKHFDDYGFYLHGFEEEDREAFFQAALALAAAPQPAQADARVGLTDEQREAIDFVIGWYEQCTIADNPYREHIAALRALLQGANHD